MPIKLHVDRDRLAAICAELKRVRQPWAARRRRLIRLFLARPDMTAAAAASKLGFSRWHVAQLLKHPEHLLVHERPGLKSAVDAGLKRKIVAGMKKAEWLNAEALRKWLAGKKIFLSKPGIYTLCAKLGVPFRASKLDKSTSQRFRRRATRGRPLLNEDEVEALELFLKQQHVENSHRLQAVLAVVGQKQKPAAVARALRIHRGTLSRWIRRVCDSSHLSIADRVMQLCQDRPYRAGRMSDPNLRNEFDRKFNSGEIQSTDDVLRFLADNKIAPCKKRTAYKYLAQARRRKQRH